MTAFWSHWVEWLLVLNLSITVFLFIWGPRVKIPTLKDGTTGHVWAHGVLKESVRRLPTWWTILSVTAFIAGGVYLVLYPGFGNYKGLFGWTERKELAHDTEVNSVPLKTFMRSLDHASVEMIAENASAVRIGQRLFIDNCAACHGREAHGNTLLGAPNLTDNDWLYGGDGNAILTSILDGRHGIMPPFGTTFDNDTIVNLSNYVLSLSGAPHDAAKAAAGKPLFAVCGACHGADGKGSTVIGAPNLTDTIWMYGGDASSIRLTIHDGRAGVMPSWRVRLGVDDARLVAAWVYSQSHPHAPQIH